jgi:hypothetical protein
LLPQYTIPDGTDQSINDPTETNLGEFIIFYSQFSPNGDGVNDNFVIEKHRQLS